MILFYMESDNRIRECKNCHHNIIREGKCWVHITSSINEGKGGFDNMGKVNIICSICGCNNPEPNL